ncbi:hypothetical protein J43TS3_27710 [Ornithinibacillus bavariensis]|uniref:Aminoglycoside phosphotransferase domain-containing protein n=2 Tax=Ornithinibacillus bavariensis TaxID=545502 RepID=A0A919XCJ2_9BACI|nr:hypothetical protein J43TS3_27710 [Ornithinibacillus bavariensis]
MDNLKTILTNHYDIDMVNYRKQQGGWAALAYEVSDETKKYFLKAYEKSRASTPKLTKRIEQYVPILIWLNNNSNLQGKIPTPYLTNTGIYLCEDEDNIYLLYDYIEGETIGDKELTGSQIQQLTYLISELHVYGEDIPFDTNAIKEDYHVPFLEPLRSIVDNRNANVSIDVRKLITMYRYVLKETIDRVEILSELLKTKNGRLALCHTDLHYWNLMQSAQLMLIDWEGLKLAPVEADMMFLVDKPYFEAFLSKYQKRHPHYSLDQDALEFYQKRRRLEDIWEFTEQLLYDNPDSQERVTVIDYLKEELKSLG